ncbi:MAG: hypothetical protein ACRDLT_18935 [Solirubrobacteraceae bacterium]
MRSVRKRSGGPLLGAALLAIAFGCGLCLALLAAVGGMTGSSSVGAGCGPPQTVGATEYGGPGDPSSGTVGASGVSLIAAPDSFAELGGTSFATAIALGGLPYGTPLQITAGGHTAVAYKEDIGLGGGPIGGHPRAIDLWWQLARSLGIPYDDGRWSGTVKVAPLSGACFDGVAPPVTAGPHAQLLPDGDASAPASAPPAVAEMIAAGNQIVGKPYVYGGAHGLPLDVVAPDYDCSSSVAHLLNGGGLLPVSDDMTSGELESWGLPGPGRWVTIYASATHVFMYVAGLRWDTWNAAGAADGSGGIGWHPLVRSAAGFVVRHPPGL